MKFLSRLFVIALWTIAMVVLLFILIFLFVYGDCLPQNQSCIDFKNGAARWLPTIVVGIYGIGLGVFLERWLLRKQ